MTTTYDYFSKLADAGQKAASSAWEKSAAAMSRIGDGLRAAPNAAGRAVGGAASAVSEAAGRASGEFAAGLRGEPAPPRAAQAKWGPSGSPEAQSYRAQPAAATPAPLEPAKPGMLRTAATKVGRMAGKVLPYAAAASGATESVGNAFSPDPTEAYRKEFGLPQMAAVGRGLRAIGVPENAAQLGDDLAVRTAGVGYKVANAATGGLLSGALPSAQAAAPAAPPAPAAPSTGGLRTAPSAEPQGDLVDLTNGGRARPSVLTDSNIGVPVPGQGAMRVGGNPALKVGGDAAMAAEDARVRENASVAQARASLRTDAQPGSAAGGVFGDIAKLGSLRAQDVAAQRDQAQMNKNVQHGLENQGQQFTREANISQRQLQIAQLSHTLGNENEKRVDARTADYVRSKAEVANPQLYADPATRASEDAKLKQKTADVNERIKHTLSVTKAGITTSTLPEATHTLLLKANDFRDRLQQARTGGGLTGKMQWAQDFFGNKQFDSGNLLSYLPARDKGGAVKPAIPETFGYSVEMGNGNKVKVYALAGGGFNFSGPNDPIDNDAMELMKPAIDAAQRK